MSRESTSRTIRIIACILSVSATVATAPNAAAQKPQEQKIAPARSANLSTPARRNATAELRATLRAPAGFQVSVFAEGVGSPRMMAVGTDGAVYVTRRDSGDVIRLRDTNGDGRSDKMDKVAGGLRHVHGIVLHQGRMFLATNNEVFVAAVGADGTLGTPRAIITDLPDAGQHPNRTLGVGPDGMLYITVGSTCNLCVDANEEAATILRARLDGSERGIFARGLRNTIGFGWHPTTGEMYGWDHGFDWLGDDFPPEEFNKLQAGHYGFPFCHGDRKVNEFYAGAPPGSTKEEFCPRSIAPLLEYQAHSAGIQMVFYSAQQFPAEYRGDAFIALRGSWNREPPTGYKIARVHFDNGKPVAIEDFLTGFLASDARSYFGRPAGIAVARDGSLLMSDDTNGIIYRVSYGAR